MIRGDQSTRGCSRARNVVSLLRLSSPVALCPLVVALTVIVLMPGCGNGDASSEGSSTNGLSAGGELSPVSTTAAEGESQASDPAQETDDHAEENAAETSEESRLAELQDPNPFPRRLDMPEFPEGMTWINTRDDLRLADLQGKFVLLDFWTYCCINCMHILPELKELEHQYPENLVVIGVHSPKFEGEQESENIRQAVLRYRIEHPVVNDFDHRIWNMLGVRSWPTMLLIDPEGKAVHLRRGEFQAEEISELIDAALPWYRTRGLLEETPLEFNMLAQTHRPGPLAFPGKVLADEASNRLFIADSNHHRIVIADLQGNLIEVVGSGQVGQADGDYATACFKSPQGMALLGERLYVADTENHLIREIDLQTKHVRTVAGTGQQMDSPWPGLTAYQPGEAFPERWVGPPRETGLGSPWALWVHQDDLFIAMAGPHQIWKMPLNETEIGPYAGNGREDIIDGPLLPEEPYAIGFSSFAQPSGLTSDGNWLYVADSEGSSIRAVPFDSEESARTVIGTSHLSSGRLFEFGDVDGDATEARLQHALGVTYHEGVIYTADTYNNKIKRVDAETGEVVTIAAGEDAEGNPLFDEPAGLCYAAGKLYVADTNQHAIRVIDLEENYSVSTLEIVGLAPPTRPESSATN